MTEEELVAFAEVRDQRNRLLSAVIGSGLPIADVDRCVREHFAGDYEMAVRFALECVRHLHQFQPLPVRISATDPDRTTKGGRKGK
jgi:hypothetical protein